MSAQSRQKNQYESFVQYLFKKCHNDKGFAARHRRADNPVTEFQSWDTLAVFNVDLNNTPVRMAYSLMSASIAKSGAEANGNLLLGHAIALAFDEGADSAQANMRLRRLLACDNGEEVCLILRSLLMLIQSRVTTTLDYARILGDLVWFDKDPQRIKARWAQEFYRKKSNDIDEQLGDK